MDKIRNTSGKQTSIHHTTFNDLKEVAIISYELNYYLQILETIVIVCTIFYIILSFVKSRTKLVQLFFFYNQAVYS